MSTTTNLANEILDKVKNYTRGELRVDETTRHLYSTDASIYQIKPFGVYFPSSVEDICGIVEICADHRVPIIPRGSGTSLAGQSIGPAIILDLSKLSRNIVVNPETRTAIVDPGVTIREINRFAAKHGLSFGPDPASADRATIGGSIANNATGAHSILYGMSADHLLSSSVVLSDGKLAKFGSIPIQTAKYRAETNPDSIEARLYFSALDIRTHHRSTVIENWPKVWRRASGYGINYIIPWSPSEPPNWHSSWNRDQLSYPPQTDREINLASLFAGSEGTLGILTEIEIRLVPKLSNKILALIEFESIEASCDATPAILDLKPTAVELIPGTMIRLARTVPAYAHQLGFIHGDPAAVLVVEFSNESNDAVYKKLNGLGANILIADSAEQQAQIWNVRKVGLGILNARPGDEKPVAFIEDLAVPVQHLGNFVRELNSILAENGTHGEFYAHASAGCLHIRPVLNLKSSIGKQKLRSIAEQSVKLTLQMGGAISGEHGDGLSRSEWIELAYGIEIVELFRKIKNAADPDGILNPGKILDPQSMDTSLRYGQDYYVQTWKTEIDFSSQNSLDGAIEMCNGAGVCLKLDDVMCPSYQATHEELYSTRGRANVLRGMISGVWLERDQGLEVAHRALDLCLACKGCKSECPSAVDMAKLKYEFLQYYHQFKHHKVRDFIFAYIEDICRYTNQVAPIVNFLLTRKIIRKFNQKYLGISEFRQLPVFHTAKNGKRQATYLTQEPIESVQDESETVILLSDTFSHYFHPETEEAALLILESIPVNVRFLTSLGAARTFISKGFLRKAKEVLYALIQNVKKLDPDGRFPVVGIEPSEIYTLRDELVDFFPNDQYAAQLKNRAWMLDEYLVRPGNAGITRHKLLNLTEIAQAESTIYIHGHCYQKTLPPSVDGYSVGTEATIEMLSLAGYQVIEIKSGCCGMAGSFGYEKEHYKLSMDIGELTLFPSIRSIPLDAEIVTTGTSCRTQINDGTARKPLHPLELIAKLLSV